MSSNYKPELPIALEQGVYDELFKGSYLGHCLNLGFNQTGKFVPEKTNIWRDCVDGYYDWVKEHIAEVSDKISHPNLYE